MALKHLFPEMDGRIIEPDRFPDTTGRIRPGDVGVRSLRQQLGKVDAATPKHDLEAWLEFLRRWRVVMPIRIELDALSNGPIVYMRMTSTQPDSRRGKRDDTMTYLTIDIPVPSPKPDEHSARWVRALLRWLVLHELDEFIEVDGDRVFDPHRGGRTPSPENS